MTKKWGIFLPLFVFGVIMTMWSFKTPICTDEYEFYKLSSNLPSYSSTADWFLKDRPSMLNFSVPWSTEEQSKAFHQVYDAQIYPHTPLMPIAMYPLVKSLNTLADKGVIPTIESQPGYPTDKSQPMSAETITKVLRFVPIILFLFSMYLIYRITRNKVGSVAYFFAVALAACYQLLMGAYLFYWDVFMMFFFVLTLYLQQKTSKWAYLTACLMVNTKMFIPMLFLIPLMVKDWKMVFAGFSILPFYFVTWAVTGQPFYVFTHYLNQLGIHDYVYQVYNFKDWALILTGLGIPLFALMTLPLFKYAKKYPEYIALFIVGCLYAFSSGLALTHMSTLLYVGAMVFPLVVYEYKLHEKFNRLFPAKKEANA